MKYRGKTEVTVEALAEAMRIPEGVAIINVQYDADREMVICYLSSENKTSDLTYETAEGQHMLKVEIPD